MLALGWCFDSLRIVDKVLALSAWLDEQGMRCVWLTRGRETQCALAMAGLTAHSVYDFVPRWQEIATAADLDEAALARCESYDRQARRRIVPLPVEEADYPAANARFCAGLWRLLLDEYRPDLLLNLNGQHCVARALAELAVREQLPLLFWENGLAPDTLVVDPQGVNYRAHLSGAAWTQIAREPLTEQLQTALDQWKAAQVASQTTLVNTGLRLTADQLRAKLKLPAESRLVLAPLQVDSDTNIVLHSPLYKSMREFVAGVQQAAQQAPGTVLLVKDHPKRAPQGDRQIEQMLGPQARYVHDVHLPSLLPICDRVVCINTTVGLEALVRGLPVLAFGRSTYSEKGLTRDLYLESDPHAALVECLTLPREALLPETAALDEFLVYLLRRHLWPVSGENALGSRAAFAAQVQSLLASAPAQPRAARPAADWWQTCLQPGRDLTPRFQQLQRHAGGVMVVRGSETSDLARIVAQRIQQSCPQLQVRDRGTLWQRVGSFWRPPVEVLDLT